MVVGVVEKDLGKPKVLPVLGVFRSFEFCLTTSSPLARSVVCWAHPTNLEDPT